jgi:hypothetical protein
LLRPHPSELANIRLYPKGSEVKDLDVLVLHNGAPLKGVQVTLLALGENYLQDGVGTFLDPNVTRAAPLTGTSDDAGHLVFAAADLVLGGHYAYVALPPDGGAAQGAAKSGPNPSDDFVLGLRSASNMTDPYRLTINLGESVPAVREVSRSTDSQDPDKTGMLVIYFNREIELVPGSADKIVASLSGNTTAALPENENGDDEPDQAKVTIEGNKLILQPIFKTNPDNDINKELDLSITYSGVQVRPKTAPETLVPWVPGDHQTMAVKFYR